MKNLEQESKSKPLVSKAIHSLRKKETQLC